MGAAKIILADLPDFCREVSYQVKKIAIKDACQAFSSGCKKAKKTGEPFKLRFRSRKSPKQSCFIPHSAETKEMAKRHQRKIRSKSVRSLLTGSHFAFKQRLKHVAKRSGKAVLDVCEAYTSKTASWTGELNYNLGGAKKITSGGLTMDRDLNGARGIFLRALVDNPGSVNTDLAVAGN